MFKQHDGLIDTMQVHCESKGGKVVKRITEQPGPSYLVKAHSHKSMVLVRQIVKVQLVFRKETAENFVRWE